VKCYFVLFFIYYIISYLFYTNDLTAAYRYILFTLHSQMQSTDQRRVFQNPGPGVRKIVSVLYSLLHPVPLARQHPSYGDCLDVKREYYQNCSVLDCVTQCSQSAAHLYKQFLQVQQIGFVTLGPLCCA